MDFLEGGEGLPVFGYFFSFILNALVFFWFLFLSLCRLDLLRIYLPHFTDFAVFGAGGGGIEGVAGGDGFEAGRDGVGYTDGAGIIRKGSTPLTF